MKPGSACASFKAACTKATNSSGVEKQVMSRLSLRFKITNVPLENMEHTRSAPTFPIVNGWLTSHNYIIWVVKKEAPVIAKGLFDGLPEECIRIDKTVSDPLFLDAFHKGATRLWVGKISQPTFRFCPGDTLFGIPIATFIKDELLFDITGGSIITIDIEDPVPLKSFFFKTNEIRPAPQKHRLFGAKRYDCFYQADEKQPIIEAALAIGDAADDGCRKMIPPAMLKQYEHYLEHCRYSEADDMRLRLAKFRLQELARVKRRSR